MARLSILFLAAFVPAASFVTAFSANDGRASSATSAAAPSSVVAATRRDYLSRTAASLIATGVVVVATTSLPHPSFALASEEDAPKITTRMGGLLENYQDPRGWTILAPSGWNKFDGEVGAYDTKWEDLVDPTDNVKVSSTPVKSTTTSV
jgi:hypothetical protein